EVEETLLGHPAIAEVAVVGAPDPLYGEVVWAFVVTHPEQPIDGATLSRWCATRLADFKRPAEFVFVPELPKNLTGKVLKAPLRALAGKRPCQAVRLEIDSGAVAPATTLAHHTASSTPAHHPPPIQPTLS